jgi:hypothetical protein
MTACDDGVWQVVHSDEPLGALCSFNWGELLYELVFMTSCIRLATGLSPFKLRVATEHIVSTHWGRYAETPLLHNALAYATICVCSLFEIRTREGTFTAEAVEEPGSVDVTEQSAVVSHA